MTDAKPSPAAALTPLIVMLFATFLVVGAAIPVLPLHVTGCLGLSAFVVGIASGAQFAAVLASRLWSGRFADRHGGKHALCIGLVVATIGGCVYFASVAAVWIPAMSVSILVELVGQALAWQSGDLASMLIGSILTGFGYSLVYPALGVEAVKRSPAHLRALAMGTCTAFLDLMLGVGGPVLGLVADHAGLQTAFAVGTAAATCSAAFTVMLQGDGIRRQPAKAIT